MFMEANWTIPLFYVLASQIFTIYILCSSSSHFNPTFPFLDLSLIIHGLLFNKPHTIFKKQGC